MARLLNVYLRTSTSEERGARPSRPKPSESRVLLVADRSVLAIGDRGSVTKVRADTSPAVAAAHMCPPWSVSHQAPYPRRVHDSLYYFAQFIRSVRAQYSNSYFRTLRISAGSYMLRPGREGKGWSWLAARTVARRNPIAWACRERERPGGGRASVIGSHVRSHTQSRAFSHSRSRSHAARRNRHDNRHLAPAPGIQLTASAQHPPYPSLTRGRRPPALASHPSRKPRPASAPPVPRCPG